MTVKFDEGTYMVLKSASGVYYCRQPRLPQKWDPINRQHIAQLLPGKDHILRVYLSTPAKTPTGYKLNICSLDSLPPGTIIEIRHSETEYSYFRKDFASWTKIGEATDPFHVDVFSFEMLQISFTKDETLSNSVTSPSRK